MKLKVNITNLLPFYIPVILLTIILCTIYSDVIFSPNSILLNKNGDGLKNYFLFAWVAKYGSLSGFTGANFPFGESILYTDSMPIFSLTLYQISKVFPTISHYSIGILHITLFSLYFISYNYLFKIFKFYNIDSWGASLGALLIILNCPSNSRILLHFGLFFILLFPILIFLCITFYQGKLRKTQLFLGLSFGYLIHGYTGAIWSGAIISFFLFQVIFNKQTKASFFGLLSSLLPTVLYFGIIHFTDHHLWRTQHPLALFDYKISFDLLFGCFFNKNIPLHTLLQFNYWFWSSLVLCLFFLGKKLYVFNETILKNHAVFMLIGCFYIIYGTSILLKWQPILLLIPQLEQLRDLLRFGWVAFICISFSLIIIENKLFPPLLFFTLITIGIIEGINYQEKITENIEAIANPFIQPNQTDIKLSKQGYSSILALPFNYDDTLTSNEEEELTINSYRLAYNTGLPLMNAYLSRLSKEEKYIKSSFILPSPSPKDYLLKYYQPEDSILIIKGNKSTSPPLGISLKPLNTFSEIEFFKGYTNDFINNCFSFDSTYKELLLYKSFDTDDQSIGFRKKGSKSIAFHGKQLIYKTNNLVLDTTKAYNLDIWLYHHQRDSLALNYIQIIQGNNLLGQKILTDNYKFSDHKWGCLSITFYPKTKNDISIMLKSKREKAVYWHEKFNHTPTEQIKREQPIYFDDLIIIEKHESYK